MLTQCMKYHKSRLKRGFTSAAGHVLTIAWARIIIAWARIIIAWARIIIAWARTGQCVAMHYHFVGTHCSLRGHALLLRGQVFIISIYFIPGLYGPIWTVLALCSSPRNK